MKTIVMGKIRTRKFEVVTTTDNEGKLLEKPYINELKSDIEWKEICSYEGTPQLSTECIFCMGIINISEDESVEIEKQIFRADVANYYQYANKILEEKPNNREECEEKLADALRVYNIQKIEADQKAKAYCDLHKLDYEETDYDELLGFINPPMSPITISTPAITISNDINPGIATLYSEHCF